MATLDIPGRGKESYFFLTYKVTNTSDEDLLLAPSFELSTGMGDLIRSGRDVPAEATRQVLDLLANPLMEDQIGILGAILKGEENAKDGVVLWPVPGFHLEDATVYASGFSGETKPYDTKDADTGRPVQKTLRKTYMARFDMPGMLNGRGGEAFPVSEQRWIMR
jgi:hypothetical protein